MSNICKTKEMFDIHNQDNGVGYFVCDYSTENDGPIAVVIGKYADWKLPHSVTDNSAYRGTYCVLSFHKTLDECFEYIKESYDKVGEGWYDGMLREHTIADLSLGPLDTKYVAKRIRKEGRGINMWRRRLIVKMRFLRQSLSTKWQIC